MLANCKAWEGIVMPSIAILNIVAIGIYTYFTYKQAKVLETQLSVYADFSRQQVNLLEAQVNAMGAMPAVISIDDYQLKPGTLMVPGYRVANPRPTPAKFETGQFLVAVRSATNPRPDVDVTNFGIQRIGGTVTSVEPLHYWPAPTMYMLTEEQVQNIRAGRDHLYFAGKLQYDDGLGHHLSTEFCKTYMEGAGWQDCP
jgi:hypothetical protein